MQGVIPPVVTPVDGRNGGVDTDSLVGLISHLEKNGVHGLFPCGTNGEFTSLSRSEWEAVTETVATNTKLPVYAGCGAMSVTETVQRSEFAADVGADAAVVVTPSYFPTSQKGLVSFYTRVADCSPLPIVLYEIPSHTGRSLSVDTINELAEHDNIIGMKDSSGDLSKLNRCISQTPNSFSVLQGSTISALASLDFGVDGIVSGEANLIPNVIVSIYEEHIGGDRDQASSFVTEQELPVTALLSESSEGMSSVPALKHLLNKQGFDVGPPLPPLPVLDQSQKKVLSRISEVGDNGSDLRS